MESSLVVSVLALLQWGLGSATNDTQHYCYTELVTALSQRCDRIYAAESTSAAGRGRRSVEVEPEVVRRRLPRDIVQQCCRRPCNVTTLQRYCSTVRAIQRASPSPIGSSTTSASTEAPVTTTTIRSRGQRSTARVANGRGSSFQSLTEAPAPDPVPVGDYNFYS